MKSKLLILSLFLYLGSFGQSVPNTTTFSLQDVVNVTGGNSLSAAFGNSVDAYFDPAYKGAKNNLLNFRNYKVNTPIYYTYYLTEANYTSSAAVCESWAAGTATIGDVVYSADATLVVGSQLFTNTALTDQYATNLTNWRGIKNSGSIKYAIIAAEGNNISDVTICSSVESYMYTASRNPYTSSSDACNNIEMDGDTIYSASSSITEGMALYWDAGLSTPYKQNPAGWWQWIHPYGTTTGAYTYYANDDSNVATSVTSCEPSYNITVSPGEFTTESNQTNSFYVDYTTDSHTYTVTTNVSWLYVSVSSINGTGNFYTDLDANSTGSSRNGSIEFRCDGVLVKTILVTQGG